MSDFTDLDNNGLLQRNIVALQQDIEATFNARVEPFNFQMLSLLSGVIRGFRLIRGEQGFTVNLLSDVTEADQANVLYEELLAAKKALALAPQRLPRPGVIEKLVVQLRFVSGSVVDSRLPPTMVKCLLISLNYLQCLMMSGIRETNEFHCSRVQALSYFMQEPQSVIVLILRQHRYFLHWNYTCRLRHLRQTESATRQSQEFFWPTRDSYLEMDRQCKDSRVLVTIHMGDFFGAFKCIAEALEESRPVISLRREGDADAIKTLSQRHAGGHQVFMHGKDNPLKIVKALRAGGQTLTVLFDLGHDFGETTDVLFFGHPARFVRGPAELAIAGKARIYPFVSFTEAGRDCIHMECAFLPELRSDETLQAAVRRVTQTLVTMAERWIRQHPSQWKYLDRLPAYLIPENEGVRRHA